MKSSRLETERLLLRKPETADILFLRKWFSDPVTSEHVGGIRSEEGVQSTLDKILKNWTEKGFGKYMILLKSTGDVIGLCGISDVMVEGQIENDLGYLITKEYWGQGFATEASKAVMHQAENELYLDRITAWPNHKNKASVRVVEKLGFIYEKQVNETHAGISFQDMSLYVWKRPIQQSV